MTDFDQANQLYRTGPPTIVDANGVPTRSESLSAQLGSSTTGTVHRIPTDGTPINLFGTVSTPRQVSMRNLGNYPIWIVAAGVYDLGFRIDPLGSTSIVTSDALFALIRSIDVSSVTLAVPPPGRLAVFS